MNWKWLIVWVLVLVIVQGVSADTVTIYATDSGELSRTTDGTWLEVWGGIGETLEQTDVETLAVGTTSTNNQWSVIRILGYTFNTSVIGSGNTVINVTFYSYGSTSANTFATDYDFSVVGFTPANYADIVIADYSQFGVKLADDSEAMSTTGYSGIILNETGRTYINKTGFTGIGLTADWVAENSPGAWENSKSFYYTGYQVAYTGTTRDPKLVIEYEASADTTPPASITSLANTTTCSSINWTFTKPEDADFNETIVWKDNALLHNLTNTTEYDNWTGLTQNTEYTFSSKTSDLTGNLNATFVNATATTTWCPPVANFTANQTSGVTPLAVGFTDTSTNTPTAWNWSFQNVTGNNTQIWWSTTQNATQTFGVGNFSIVLNASNSAGYDITPGIYFINVSSSAITPVASFTKSRVITHIPQPITFTDTSTNTPTSWLWSFSDQSADVTTQSPTHSFARPGLFTITLTSTNAAGSSTATDRIWAVSRLYGTPITPYRVSVSCNDATYSVSRELTEQERFRTEELIMNLCNPL